MTKATQNHTGSVREIVGVRKKLIKNSSMSFLSIPPLKIPEDSKDYMVDTPENKESYRMPVDGS